MADNASDPQPRASAAGNVMLILGILALVLAAGLVLAVLIFIVPRFQQVFNDFGVELPIMTRTTLQASSFVVGHKALSVSLIVAFIGGLVALVALLPRHWRLLLRIYSVVGWIILGCIVVVLVLGLYLPLINLMSGMASRGA